MTVAEDVGRTCERVALPATTLAWPEVPDSLGFVGRDSVDFAAAWFERLPERHRRWIKPGDPEFDPHRSVATQRRWVAGVPCFQRVPFGPWYPEPADDESNRETRCDGEAGYFVDTFGGSSKHRSEMAALDYRLVITPGTVGLRVTDPRDTTDTILADIEIDADGNVVERPPPKREPITEFSRKSRTNLVRRCLSIPWGDYVEPGERLYFVTLTAPADHLAVFADHRDGYRALRSFQSRIANATGRPARGFWKLEFQRRGAPHWHLILIAPKRIKGRRLRRWISEAWYESVGSGAESHLRAGTNVDIEQSVFASDALRLALYFAGYSTGKDKEYQHRVPEEGWVDENGSTGRFWGYFGVKPAEQEVRITEADLVQVKRLLRARERSQRGSIRFDELPEAKQQAWLRCGRRPDAGGRVSVPLTRAQAVYRTVRQLDRTGPHPEHGPDPVVCRSVRRRRRTRSFTGAVAGCTAFVNNGPELAVAIARAIDLTKPTTDPWPKGRRRPLP